MLLVVLLYYLHLLVVLLFYFTIVEITKAWVITLPLGPFYWTWRMINYISWPPPIKMIQRIEHSTFMKYDEDTFQLGKCVALYMPDWSFNWSLSCDGKWGYRRQMSALLLTTEAGDSVGLCGPYRGSIMERLSPEIEVMKCRPPSSITRGKMEQVSHDLWQYWNLTRWNISTLFWAGRQLFHHINSFLPNIPR